MKNSTALAKLFIEQLGNAENISTVTSCMTRVRCTINDPSKVNYENIKNIEEVLSVVEGNQTQIVVGPGLCTKIANEMNKLLGLMDWQANKAEVTANQSGLSRVLKQIANIFVPLIPAIIGAGILNGIAGYFSNILTSEGIKEIPIWITFFQTIGNGLFAYFAVYVGINSANEFGATPGLGGIIGAITISPNINILSKKLGLFDIDTPLNSILTTGKGGIIGVIASVALLAWVEKKVRKIIPDIVTTFFTPIISLVSVALVLIFAIMPIAGFISDAIIKVFSILILSEGIISIIGGFVLAASFLPLVMVGLHHGLIPFYLIQLEQTGAISLFPILCMAGAGQVGGAIAIYLRSRQNNKLQNIIRASLPVGFLGIGEPLLYGVTLPLGRPFITMSIGGGIGGIFVTMNKVQSIAFGPAGLAAIPLMLPDKMITYIIGIVIAYIFGFILTYLFGIPKNINNF